MTLVSKIPHETVTTVAEPSTESSGERTPGRVGSILGDRHELTAHRGNDGGVDVYDAKDSRSGEAVIVRILEDAPAETRARFSADVGRIAKLSHPCIAQIVDHGIDGGIAPYYVTAVADGDTVDAVLRNSGTISGDDAVLIASAALSGLQAAHKAGVFHGDVRPQNIVLAKRADGGTDPRLIHFGLALPLPLKKQPVLVKKTITGLGNPSSQVLTSASFGTLPFAAPEQLGKGDVDARTDVYGVAATLHEMLSGKPLFEGSSAEMLESVLAGKVEPLATRAPEAEVPEALDYAVRRGLALEPADRPASASEFGALLWQALAEARRGVRLAPRPTEDRDSALAAGVPGPFWRSRGSLPWVVLAALAALVSLGWFFGRGPGGLEGGNAPADAIAATSVPVASAAPAPGSASAAASTGESASGASTVQSAPTAAGPPSGDRTAKTAAPRVDAALAPPSRPTATSYKIDDLKQPYR